MMTKAEAKVGLRVRAQGSGREGTIVLNDAWNIDVAVEFDNSTEDEPEQVDPFFLEAV